MSYTAIIPARMGSQRLPKKNLRELNGVSLIARAIRKCKDAGCFDKIYVNSEHPAFGEIAKAEGVEFYQRPQELGSNTATSEDFITDFLQNVDGIENLVQVHSIAPLLTVDEIKGFIEHWEDVKTDVLLSCILDRIEVAFKGSPVNFTFDEKTNSQDLLPLQRITWSITGWKSETFLNAIKNGRNATYAGEVGFFEVSPISGHVIKTERDLKIAEVFLSNMQ